MHQLSTICFTLVVVSVLVQSASGKRGCAAFGHACYGGHGKRSSAPASPIYSEGFDPSVMSLEVLPIPYSKLVMDKPRTMDPSTDGLRSNDVYGVDASVLGHRADTKSREFKYAIYAMLRQLMEESAANRSEQPTHLQQQQSGHQPPSFQRDLSGVTDVERK
ncbi:uncharacterized protein LOC131288632 [Anopheles ziemanni]|nr:uncharacterized protein LOC131258660 isoform X2 [Anopheles coustani]XP_058116002.1 uncharacterized protein LOC131258660 isoform X2 [Anopheles coustani]XP_058173766.1 uncharacterized protein LOC131288632 [Anopheles ziemanni]